MKKILPGTHFVLYQPKQSIGGDFFYVKERDGYIIFAVADCTGHGVSGALITMLGISFLTAQDLPPKQPLPFPNPPPFCSWVPAFLAWWVTTASVSTKRAKQDFDSIIKSDMVSQNPPVHLGGFFLFLFRSRSWLET